MEAAKLLDFRYAKYGCPIADLTEFFYFIVLQSELHLNCLSKYLDIYYESFSKTVRNFNLDPKILFPRGDIEEEWRKCSKFTMLTVLASLSRKYFGKEFIQETVATNENKKEMVMFNFYARAILHQMHKMQVL